MNIEDTSIKKEKKEFFVENVEDMIIRVEVEQVEDILKRISDVEEEEVAILLATIKISRMTNGKEYRKVKEDKATRAIIQLLEHYSIDNLIVFFEEMKYFQIKEVLESSYPIDILEGYI